MALSPSAEFPLRPRGARRYFCFMRIAALLVALLAGSTASAVNHPFGSHPMPYAAGSIVPSHVSAATRDQTVRDFYDAWKARYLRQTCGPGRYVVEASTRSGNLTVSEAHGYGMILAALMAGHDPDAKIIFDGMVAFFREHPTATHDHLMSWYQRTTCSDAEGNDSASDGDLDIAFALLLADKQWGSCGAIDYLAEAEAVLADLKDGDLDDTHRYVLLGDWVTPASPGYYDATRSSDFMMDHYRSFGAATGDADWSALLSRSYVILDAVQTSHAPATGLVPDFIADPLGTPDPVASGFLEGANDGAYHYNACRVPWRVATDFLVSDNTRAPVVAQRLTTSAQTTTGNTPSAFRSGYQLNGIPSPGSDYLSMAFVAPLGVGAMVDAGNQAWLNALWDLAVATPITAEGYYENTLKLLALVAMSGNWWAPETVTGGCTPSGTPFCTDGGTLADADVKIGRAVAPSGDETLKLKGRAFLPQGLPASLTDGTQLVLEDLGAGSTTVYELSAATSAVPAATTAGCDARDGWKATTKSARYRNKSGALPPACAAGSAHGLTTLTHKVGRSSDLGVTAAAKRATIAAPVGPVRATVVLGATAGASAAGQCAVSAPLDCTAAGASIRCR